MLWGVYALFYVVIMGIAGVRAWKDHASASDNPSWQCPDAYFGILFVLFTLIVGLWAWIMAIPRSAASPR